MTPIAIIVLSLFAQSTDVPALSGRWRDADLKLTSEFTQSTDGTWSAVVVAAPTAKDVGKKTFDQVKWEPEAKRFRGKLIKPDDGQVVDITLTIDSPEQMTGKAGFFIFTKTLHFTRVVPDAGSAP